MAAAISAGPAPAANRRSTSTSRGDRGVVRHLQRLQPELRVNDPFPGGNLPDRADQFGGRGAFGHEPGHVGGQRPTRGGCCGSEACTAGRPAA
jgi:hypothetical protein